MTTVPISVPSDEPIASTWQQSIKRAVRNSKDLCNALGLVPADLGISQDGENQFPVFVPLEFLNRMQKGDSRDPLLLQVLPREAESIADPNFHFDPVGDSKVEQAPGLLHKYAGRVLLVLSGACAIHCRYCFRRHYPYGTAPKKLEHWLPALDYIRSDPTIHEVILSGGDPLSLVDASLAELVALLDEIPHLTRLRVHTRLPVVIPQRVNAELCDWLKRTRLAKWIVLHINHSQEIDTPLADAIARLRCTGATLLNQSVLLRGINDSTDDQVELCERLINLGVMPYYLHQLDRVSGATHFEVPETRGLEIVSELAKRLPGFAVPKYVAEVAGEESKTVVLPENQKHHGITR